MKQLFILLTACILTAPTVFAEEVGPVACQPGLESGSCSVVYDLGNPTGDPASSASTNCPSIDVSYNLNAWLPANADPHIECVHQQP